MGNRDIDIAVSYHNATKHSYVSVRTGGHFLDWDNKPEIYKIYPKLERISVPGDFSSPEEKALDAVGAFELDQNERQSLDTMKLAQILYFSGGLTRKIRFLGGHLHFRAAASAGALYPIEFYVICDEIPGLEAGVYHFNPAEFVLTLLRKGDYRHELARTAGGRKEIAQAPASIIMTAIFWRSAWKYQARSYRYCFWDAGTILANLLATAYATRMKSKVICAFLDPMVNNLLGIDGEHEGSLCVVPLEASNNSASEPVISSPEQMRHEASPLSRKETEYSEIRQLHSASSFTEIEELSSWTPAELMQKKLPEDHHSSFPLRVLSEDRWPPQSLGEVIRRRGSTRKFSQDTLTFPQLSTMIDYSTRGVPADFLAGPKDTLLDIFLIINAVDELPAGAFYYSTSEKAFELLKKGTFRPWASYLCLEQDLAADAAAVVFFMSDLRKVLQRFGNRGYRAVQLEAGMVGGKMYLCSYALGLGASGLTFYDDDITEFFSPYSEGLSPIFVVALGLPARTRRLHQLS